LIKLGRERAARTIWLASLGEPCAGAFTEFVCRIEPNGDWRVRTLSISGGAGRVLSETHPNRGKPMVITAEHITPLVALIAGILILIMPRLLNFIVAIYLIIVGLMGLNGIYHFVH
jgi:hypothetical protein